MDSNAAGHQSNRTPSLRRQPLDAINVSHGQSLAGLPANGIRFGSTDSLDRDTLYVVDEVPDGTVSKALCSNSSENRNLIAVKNGVITEAYKGLPDETNNALFATYGLHQQNVETNPVTRAVKRIVPLKVVRATRVVLSLLSRTEYREEVKASLKSNNQAKRQAALAAIDFSKLELSPDAIKAIAFQLVQTNVLIEGQEIYTKGELQDASPTLAPLIARNKGDLSALNDARDAFVEKLSGVYVRTKGDLNLFMYGNALAIKDWNQFARQSRGMIIDLKRERCVFFPMDKFFRFGEGPEVGRDAISPHAEVEIVEKLDGSMVSLFVHDGQLEFSCKGNFDTEQSERAAQIAKNLPVAQLQTDRYWHTFEVIYPENRFPQGLSVVDYGQREDLVLTSVRDRHTNELLPYADIIAEAKRVGLNHPRVFEGGLHDAFRAVDSSAGSLGDEGFIIRNAQDGKYFKLKHPAYKTALKAVNEMRSDRFVDNYVRASSEERENVMIALPPDIRAVAKDQLARHNEIMQKIKDYSASIRALKRSDEKEFATYVRQNVPKELQRIVFAEQRGMPVADLLEKAALKVYYGELQVPESISKSKQRNSGATDK